MSTPRVGVIISFNNKYLCVYQNASNLWGFPKGRLKADETYKRGACRELFEETGIYIYSSHLNINNMIHIKRGKHHHYYFLVNLNFYPSVSIDNYEITDYKWMSLDELEKVKTSFFTEQVVRRLQRLQYMKRNVTETNMKNTQDKDTTEAMEVIDKMD